MSNNSKIYVATTASNIKRIIRFYKKRLGSGVSTRQENVYVCAEHCRCATALFLLSILSKSCIININHGISAPGHGREVVVGMNTTEKRFIFHMMATVQLTGSKWFDTQIIVPTATQNTDVNTGISKQLSNE